MRIRSRFVRLIFFMIAAEIFAVNNCFAQEHKIPLTKQQDIELLNFHESKAKDFVSKNLNRFAYERLQKYDFSLDSMYNLEKKDTLAIIENAYQTASAAKKSSINSLNKEISENTTKKDILGKRYWSLIRKAILSFALWITIILILLQFRKIRLRKINIKYETTKVQLGIMEDSAKRAEKLFENFSQLKTPLQKLNSELSEVNDLITDATTKSDVSQDLKNISSKTNLLKRSIEGEEKILDAVLLQKNEPSDEKSLTDINELCEQFTEIALRGFMNSAEFNCQVVKDFEKRLSPVKINSVAVGSLILNVLTNAFQSVREQFEKGIKGYQPKITISTRILPRFLQIRIRDNGTGMKEEVLKMATEEFFTTRSSTGGSGLGLTIVNSIITEMHKGEIKIESEDGASTDIYIKFFI